MKVLSEYFYGGIDWHDSYSVCNTMYHNGKICDNEEDYIEAIADSFNDIKEFFTVTRDEFLQILRDVHNGVKEKVAIPMYVKEVVDGKEEISFEADEIDGKKYYSNTMFVFLEEDDYLTIEHSIYYGQVSYYYHYRDVEISDDEIAYMVCESFHAPTKGVPCVERLYTDLFDNLEEAESYREELDADIDFINNNPKTITKSESTLNIVSRKDITGNEFYKSNMEAVALMKQKGSCRLSDDFRIFVDNHIEVLKK